jgi:peptide/nickel transport system ATP-binding protein
VRGPLLEVSGLTVEYPLRGRFGLSVRGRVRALEDLSFTLAHGETLALVGRSGSGKSSVGRALVGLVRSRAGRALYRREPEASAVDLLVLAGSARRGVQRELGIVFQDPVQSLNPRMPVGEAVAEPLRVHGRLPAPAARAEAARLFERVGLEPGGLARFPHEFSGGQRQRIAIARALALGPRFLVLDEAVSALDVAIRAQILELLAELQRELRLAYLFITHDLALARAMAGHVVVLADGRAVESGPVEEVLSRPRHPATQQLVSAILSGDPRRRSEAVVGASSRDGGDRAR